MDRVPHLTGSEDVIEAGEVFAELHGVYVATQHTATASIMAG